MTTTSYRERIAEARARGHQHRRFALRVRRPCLFFAGNAFKTSRLQPDAGCKQVATKHKYIAVVITVVKTKV